MNMEGRDSSSINHQSFRNSSLLAALPAECISALLPHLLPINLGQGDILYDNVSRPQYLYFPTNSMVSLVHELEDGFSTEVAVIGREGLVGVSLLIGADHSMSLAVAQTAGGAFQIKTAILQREFDKGGPLQHLLLLNTQAVITQISQTAACNRHHSVYQRFCRWLLLSLDRSPSNHLQMTHELIANNLGVRRESVTEAAQMLQTANLIKYQRGLISVLDRLGLEAMACECYAVVKNEYDRLQPHVAVMDNQPAHSIGRSKDSVGPKRAGHRIRTQEAELGSG